MREFWILETYSENEGAWFPGPGWYGTRELALAARDRLAADGVFEWRVSKWVREEAN